MKMPGNTPISSKKVQYVVGKCIDLLLDIEEDQKTSLIPAYYLDETMEVLDLLRDLSERRFNQL